MVQEQLCLVDKFRPAEATINLVQVLHVPGAEVVRGKALYLQVTNGRGSRGTWSQTWGLASLRNRIVVASSEEKSSTIPTLVASLPAPLLPLTLPALLFISLALDLLMRVHQGRSC